MTDHLTSQIKQRIHNLQLSLDPHQAILLSRSSDLFYFSGFIQTVPEERSAFLLISQANSHLFLQNFLAVPEEFPGQVLTGASPVRLTEHFKQMTAELKLEKILLDLENLSVEEFRAISKVETLKIGTLDKKTIWQLRCQKDEDEIKKIKTAAKITKQAVAETIQELRVGLTELEVKQILENKIRQNLFCDLAFPSIIAFDEHSTLPHHQSDNKKLENGSVVLIDAGAKYQQYCADMTRTFFFQEKSVPSRSSKDELEEIRLKKADFEEILSIVQTAYDRAEALLPSPSITAADLDLACRNHIAEQGYDKHFIHTTGHGLGIDIHEPPSVYKSNPSKLLPGMVLTIEPGIYLPGKFGVRWENTVFYI